MSLDDRIGRGLESIANRVEPDPASGLSGVRRRHRRKVAARAAGSVAAGGLAVVIALVAVPALLPDAGPEPPDGFAGSPIPPATGVPESFVVVNGFAVERYSTGTGERGGTLFDDPDWGSASASVSPDRETVYIGAERQPVASPDPTFTIVSMPINGGTRTEIARGRFPAIGPDGRTLAFVGRGREVRVESADLRCYGDEVIVLRNLQTGEELTIDGWPTDRRDPYEACSGPRNLAWSPDGTRLAFERNVGDPLYEVWVVTLTADGPRLDRVETDRSIRAPVFTADGDLLVVEEIDFHGPARRTPIARIDGATLRIDDGPSLYEAPDITSIAYDSSRAHLLVARSECGEDGCTLIVSRWIGTDEVAEIARIRLGEEGIGLATW